MKQSTYFAAKSSFDLQQVCNRTQATLHLPDFHFDAEDEWEYATSEVIEFSISITKTDDLNTIANWSKSAPNDVNFQIIFTSTQVNHSTWIERVEVALKKALETSLIKYQTMHAASVG